MTENIKTDSQEDKYEYPIERTNGDLIVQLIAHEGCRPAPYKCAAGKWTIGIGRNLESIGLSAEEAEYLSGILFVRSSPWFYTGNGFDIGGRDLSVRPLDYIEQVYLLKNDILRVKGELAEFQWFSSLSIPRKHAMIDLCFNIGITKFRGFKKMIAAIERGDYAAAASEMLDSKWFRDVGPKRSCYCADLMLDAVGTIYETKEIYVDTTTQI